jgi:hypothetical protein
MLIREQRWSECLEVIELAYCIFWRLLLAFDGSRILVQQQSRNMIDLCGH